MEALQITEHADKFFAALREPVGKTLIKSVERVVFVSMEAKTESVNDAVIFMATVVDELHHRYGVTGFLAPCGVIQLADREKVRASMEGIYTEEQIEALVSRIPETPRFCVYSFVQIAHHHDMPGAQNFLKSLGLGGTDGIVGTRKIRKT